MVARDALDYETGDRAWTLVVRVGDDGGLNNTRLPPVAPTWSDVTVTITLTDVPDAPVITGIAGVPQAGLPTRGGQALVLSGDDAAGADTDAVPLVDAVPDVEEVGEIGRAHV